MADSNLKEAKYVYKQLREYLDSNDIKYESNDSEMNVWFGGRGDDMKIVLDIYVDAESQRVRLMSLFETIIPEELRNEVSVAINKLNYGFVNGRVDFEYDSGRLGFSLRIPFMDAVLSDEAFRYMIGTAFTTVDLLNDKFYLLSEGKITCDQLLKTVFGD